MKLAPNGGPAVEIIGTQATQQAFQIKASAMAFRILSSGLYSDQVKAVIRELSTNAYDAHLEFGKGEVPFKVHLPTRFEPWFAVTDQGVGMDHDRVIHNYTTYFGSSKQDTNELVGCLGLGSKSPFAYTEQFTVVSVKDGVRRTYNAMITEEGYPQVMLLAEEPTTEPNGVHVQFPVKTQDIYEFHQKARQVYLDFPVQPEVNNINGGPLEKIQYSVKNDFWGLRKGHYSDMGYYVRARVVQGCVAYPLDHDQLDFSHPLLNSNVDLFVPIGTVEVTPSRESLNYTQFTKSNLKAFLEDVLEGLVQDYVKSFDQCKTRIEAILKMGQLRKDGGELFRAVEKRLYDHPFKNFKLKSDYIEVDQLDFPYVDLCKPDFNEKSTTLDSLFNNYVTRHKSLTTGKFDGWGEQEINVRIYEKVMVVYDDLGKAGVRTLLSRMDGSSHFDYHLDGIRHSYQVLVITPFMEPYQHGTSKAGEPIMRKRVHAEAYDQALALAEMFEAEVVLASEALVKYPAPKRTASLRSKSKVRQMELARKSGYWNSEYTIKWTADGIDTTMEELEGEPKIFVPIQDRKAFVERWMTTNENLFELRKQFIALGVIDETTQIFGVPVKYMDEITKDNPEWVPLLDLVKAHLENHLTDRQKSLLGAAQAEHSVSQLAKVLQLVESDSRLKGSWLADIVTPFKSRLDALEAASTYWNEEMQLVSKIRAWMTQFGLPIPAMEVEDMKTVQSALIKAHPAILECNRNMLNMYVQMVQQIQDLQAKVDLLESQLSQA